MEVIQIPDYNTLDKQERGDWVCYFRGSRKYVNNYKEFLKKNNIMIWDYNFNNPNKLYYITKSGNLEEMNYKDFFDRINDNSLSNNISEALIGKTFKEKIKNSYEIIFDK